MLDYRAIIIFLIFDNNLVLQRCIKGSKVLLKPFQVNYQCINIEAFK